MTIKDNVKIGEDFLYEFPASDIPPLDGVITAVWSVKDESDFRIYKSNPLVVTVGEPFTIKIPADTTSGWVADAVVDMDVRFTSAESDRVEISDTIVITIEDSASTAPVTPTDGGGTTAGGATEAQVEQLDKATSDISDLATKLATLKDRVDGFTHLTQEQRDTVDEIAGETGGARGLITRVLANDAKHSFTPADAQTLAEVAARHQRTEEEVLQIVATAPANADTMQKLADLLQGQADLNTRIDELPDTPAGISQQTLDAINANTAKTGITAQEQADIVTNTEKVGITPTQAAALLKLIDDLEAANLRIDENAALRRITPQEIADIGELKARVNITQEQADKIAASDAEHAHLESEIAEVRAIAEEAGLGATAEDFIEEVGTLDAVNPSVRHEGVNGDPITFAEITLPLHTQFPDLDAGRTIRISEMYLIPLFGDQGGAESLFYYRIEQGSETLSGRGNPTAGDPTRQVVERDWVQVNVEDSSAQLVFNAKAGSDPVIKLAMIWTGTSGSFSPRVTAGKLHYIGRLREPVAGVVRDVVGGALDGLQANDATQTADIEALRVDTDTNTQGVTDNFAFGHATRGLIETPAMRALRESTIETTETEIIEATELNTQLGGGSANFAEQIKDDAVGDATLFLTRVTKPTQVLDYGAGRILDVYNGRVRGFILRPHQDATVREETRYITTDGGLGTRAEPAVLEFGNGANPPRAEDNEVLLTEGIPEVGAEITNISMAFAVRTNDNWASIPNTLQFAIRSGEERSFAVPSVTGVTFTAMALANGDIRCRATHPSGGDPSQLVTNGGAIRFDAAYVETIRTAQVDRGQDTVDLGAFTGNNVVGFDAIQTGDNDEATAYYVTPTGRFNTGYFLLDVHRAAFATDNDTFSMLISESTAELTPDIMSQLVGSDEYLGLFRRTNHAEDAWDAGRVVIGRHPKTGERVVLGEDVSGGVAVSPVKITRLVFTGDGVAPAILPEGGRFAGAIRNGQIPLTELNLGAGEVRRIIGFGGRVIVKCDNSTNLDIGLQTATGLDIDLYDVDLNLNLASLDTAERLSLGKDDGTDLSYIVGGVGATVADDCQFELSIRYFKEQLFP